MEPAPDIKYKRLTRSGGRGGFIVAVRSRASLRLGPDHLLLVESNGYTEIYKRFYLRDIQAIVIQKTRNFQIFNFVLGIIVLVFLLLTIAIMPKTASGWTEDITPWIIVLGIITGLFLLFLLINLIAGRTCNTFLRTAVQIEQLPSLSRVRKTRRTLAKIHPLIVAAQGGELSAEAVSEQMREWNEPASEASPSQIAVDDPNVPPKLDS
jgi:hypothetical protein